jgi:flagellin-like protein
MKRKMNTRSRKALSPVVASIILIAVTVAVSIAVAAWMGALSFNFMNTEQLSITNAVLNPTASTIDLTVANSGSTNIVLSAAYVNGAAVTATGWTQTITANTNDAVALTTVTLVSGSTYQIKLMSTKGNSFVYTAVCP